MEEERGNRIELFKDIFSARLKEIRAERQLSQKAIADKLRGTAFLVQSLRRHCKGGDEIII